jgi:hypothetical protein
MCLCTIVIAVLGVLVASTATRDSSRVTGVAASAVFMPVTVPRVKLLDTFPQPNSAAFFRP